MQSKYDKFFIGDIHGRLDKLETLLNDIGWDIEEPCYHLVFVGDLIDNQTNPNVQQIKLLSFVKELVNKGLATCILGNHEFNAIGWATYHPDTGLPLRKHSENNHKQHHAFLTEVGESSALHQEWVDWFKKRPLFVEFAEVRAIHACWNDECIERIKSYLDSSNCIREEHWINAFDESHELFELIEILLKGPEVNLPKGITFKDKNGIERRTIRIAWWNDTARTYRELALIEDKYRSLLPDIPITDIDCKPVTNPVFVGHYSLSGEPMLQNEKVACVDYNAQKDQYPLVGYLYSNTVDTDSQLSHDQFFYEGRISFFETTEGQISKVLLTSVDEKLSKLRKLELESENPITGIAYEATAQYPVRHQTAVDRVDEYLWLQWDPIGVNDWEDCRDEYQAYCEDVTRFVLFGSIEDLALYLWVTIVYQLGLSANSIEEQNTLKQDCAVHANRLRQLVWK